MTTEQAREVFTKAADAAAAKGDKDACARIEVAREYFTNPAFAQALRDYLWSIRKI